MIKTLINATIGDRYGTNVDKALAEASTGISDPEARIEFLNRNKLRLEQGKERMKQLAFGKERDFERAFITDSLNNLSDTAMVGEISDIEATKQTVSGLVDGGVEMGYYNNEEAGKLKKRLENEIYSWSHGIDGRPNQRKKR